MARFLKNSLGTGLTENRNHAIQITIKQVSMLLKGEHMIGTNLPVALGAFIQATP